MKIAFARIYTLNGKSNYNIVFDLYKKSISRDVDIVVFPRLSLTGLNFNNSFNNEIFIEKYRKDMELLVNETVGEKTKIFIGGINNDDGKFFDSVFFINDGYIESISSRKEINKNNIFNDYKYFDKSLILNQFLINKKKFSILISDDIYSNFNIFLVSDNKPDYIFCFDTSIQDIEKRKKHLIKLAKFANSPVFYINNATIHCNNYFKGEVILINEEFEIKYYDIYKTDDLLIFDIDCEDGTELFLDKNLKTNIDIGYLFKKENKVVCLDNISDEDKKYLGKFKKISFDNNLLKNYINLDLFNSLSEESKNNVKSIIIDIISK